MNSTSDDLSNAAREALASICNHINIKEKDHNRQTINELVHFDLIIIHNGVLSPTSKGLSTWLFGHDPKTINDEIAKFATKNMNFKDKSQMQGDEISIIDTDRAEIRTKKKIKHTLNEFEADKSDSENHWVNLFTARPSEFTVPIASYPARRISKNEAFTMRDLYDAIELVPSELYKPRVLSRLINDGYVQRFDGCATLSDDNESIATEEGDFVTLTEKGVAWVLFGDIDVAMVYYQDNTKDFSFYIWSTSKIVSEML